MKALPLVAALTFIHGISFTSLATAGPGQSNGNKFRSLITLIESNSAAIEANSSNIASLQNKLNTLEVQLIETDARVSNLLDTTESNSTAVEELTDLVIENSSTQEQQISDLEASINALEEAITNINSRIDSITNQGTVFDFEDGPQGWTIGADSTTQVGFFTNERASWGLGTEISGFVGQALTSTWWVNTNNGVLGAERSYVTSPVLVADSEQITITFDSYTSNEGGYPEIYDVEHVQISVNGSTFTDIHGFDENLHNSFDRTFRTISYSIETGIATGDEIQIRFLLDTGDNSGGEPDIQGWGFDNVIVGGASQ